MRHNVFSYPQNCHQNTDTVLTGRKGGWKLDLVK